MTDHVEKALTDCLNHMDADAMPLHDVFRALFGFNLSPTDSTFNETLKFVIVLLTSQNIICQEGPEMTPTQKSVPELLSFLQTKWEEGKYNEINYGIWFKKKNES